MIRHGCLLSSPNQARNQARVGTGEGRHADIVVSPARKRRGKVMSDTPRISPVKCFFLSYSGFLCFETRYKRQRRLWRFPLCVEFCTGPTYVRTLRSLLLP